MGSSASKDGAKNDGDNPRDGTRNAQGWDAGSGANRHLDREQRPRNTHDDLFSTDPFHPHSDIRTIDELGHRDAYPAGGNSFPDERFDDRNDHRVQPVRVEDSEQPRVVRRAAPVGNVDRWMGDQPWLGRDGWPERHPNDENEGYGHLPEATNPRQAGHQIVHPPRYEDVVPVRRPAPRPPQPIETQQTQAPVLVVNQNSGNQPQARPRLDGDSKPANKNLQNVEVESLLSYGQGGENDQSNPAKESDVTKNVHAFSNVEGMDEDGAKVSIDEREKIRNKNGDVVIPTFKEDDDEYIGANLRFYRNEIKFRPHGEYIENIHKYWYGDYQRLENSQNYIQWLFPLAERSSVNPYALPLQKHEAKFIKDDDETYGRVVTSFQMMLNFYGMTLTDPNTGEVSRSDIWRERFAHLKRSGKNYFRITRIIRSLGALGLYLYQAPFVMFLLHEVLETKELAAVPPGIVNTWLGAIDNAFDREYVRKQFQLLLNDMNTLYEKKNVQIRVQENRYYDSARRNNDREEREERPVYRQRQRYMYTRGEPRIEE